MAWTYTKTNWRRGEWFDTIADYNRIKNNYKFLHELSLLYFSFYSIIKIEDKTYDSDTFMEFFNYIEENIDKIANGTFKMPNFESTKRYKGNDNAWDYYDINRIERMSLLFYNMLSSLAFNTLETGAFSTSEDFTSQILGA